MSRYPNRRELLRYCGGVAVFAACQRGARKPKEKEAHDMSSSSKHRMPAIFLPHGGGPWPWMEQYRAHYSNMSEYMAGLPSILPARPAAVLVISAHWEEARPTVMTSAKPPMLYDYYGFPDETYRVQWPAPGAVDIAGEIESHLSAAGISAVSDPQRGFDHGTFVPLTLAYPNADVPTLQLSLRAGLDPAEHIAIGRALAPLRSHGVFIVGSGMSYHNLRELLGNIRRGASNRIDDSVAFDDWLVEAMGKTADRREQSLVEWAQAPAARACHPREEHLIPLHVIAGAAADDAASLPYRDELFGARISAVHFG